MGLFRKSCWIQPRASAPDPSRWTLIAGETYVKGRTCCTIVEVQYSGCTNFEGRKIMVYERRTIDDFRVIYALDPHFADDLSSPIARFNPRRDWELARAFFARTGFYGGMICLDVGRRKKEACPWFETRACAPAGAPLRPEGKVYKGGCVSFPCSISGRETRTSGASTRSDTRLNPVTNPYVAKKIFSQRIATQPSFVMLPAQAPLSLKSGIFAPLYSGGAFAFHGVAGTTRPKDRYRWLRIKEASSSAP